LALLAREAPLDIWHQSGERWLTQTEASYQAAQIKARVAPFITDMAEAYGWADLVICRAGALTVAELTAAGVGAVLVPFAAAVDDHQTFNARYLVEEGAALLVAESDLTAENLARELKPLCQGRGRLLALAERARLLARPHATDELVAACLSYAGAAA
jgi:UDP-N-acetylglucosamine--N-acetylmuramyl-(pentapeptide) pyrophosphoryl-undecaprenol N-acetylglucosamine transferase